VLAPTGAEPLGPPQDPPARRSPYLKLLIAVGVSLLLWVLLPHLPQDQTLIFVLGERADRVAQLDVQWEAIGKDHEGSLTLNFPAPTPERVVRQFRLTDGEYVFRVRALRRDSQTERAEVSRRATLDGNSVSLHLEELTQ
jgi:hypothetical protein